jgi:hypothetical protein
MPMAVPGQQTANALAGICQSPRQVVGLNPATRTLPDPHRPLSTPAGSIRESVQQPVPQPVTARKRRSRLRNLVMDLVAAPSDA